ncbi:MAG: exodeoxyribonuclease Xth [Caulobacter sp.]|nr:exodeoxyribonuclease Xth [Caulobacter sp.]
MRLASFNINGVNTRLEHLIQWLEETRPDVACLQEIKTPDDRFPFERLERAGYGAVVKGQKSWHGVAILARGAEPVVTRRSLPGDPSDSEARYIEAAVGGVLVGCLYLPNGNPWPGPRFAYKQAWFARFNAHARSLLDSGHPVALIGDYNVVPTDADIYNPASWRKNALLQPEPRASYAELLGQGWTDALAALYPDDPQWTFWTNLRNRWANDKGMRIDHLLLSPDLAERLAAGGVDREARGRAGASDHAPVWIDLRDGLK